MIGAVSNYVPSIGTILSNVNANRGLVVTMLALTAISNLPTVAAGAGAYMSCIGVCAQSMGGGWYAAIICPTICAPMLLAPG